VHPDAYRPGFKACARCLRWLPHDEFYAAAHTNDGKQGWCKDCSRAYVRDWKRTRRAIGA